MKALRIVFPLGLLIGIGIGIPGVRTSGQTTSPKEAQPQSQGLRTLTGDDAKHAEKLDKANQAALKADRWDEATAKANELVALRTRTQRPNQDRAADQSADTINEQALNFNVQGKYAEAQPLFEKALEIRRRLLTDDHPHTAASYNNLAANLDAQGKYAQAQPLVEKALEIRRRLLSDDHPDSDVSCENVATNLAHQGKYAAAQPLYEKALGITRRLLGENHPDTVRSKKNVTANLDAQEKDLGAQDRRLAAVKSLDETRLRVGW
jgi:tetratricopeptide (TPR) repeat protein